MAATATVVAQLNSSSAGSQTGVTASFTPTANTKLVVLASCLNNNHTTAKSWSVSGGSLSWTIDSTSASWEMAVGANFDNQMILAWADVGGSPSSMTVTVDAFSGTDTGWYGLSVYEVSGATPGVFGSIQTPVFVDGNAAAPALTLGASKTANSVLLAVVHSISDGGVPAWAADPGGWTVATKPTGTDGVNVSSLNSTTDSDASLTGYGTTSNTSDMVGAIVEIGEYLGLLDQKDFRWGLDDGSESAHTFDAAQGADITTATAQTRLLRTLIQSTDDVPSTAYKLKYQANGAGGYVDVPIGSTSKITPVIESGDITSSGNNTAQASWAVSTPAAVTGDLIIMCLGWDDSVNTTDATPANGPNGETWTRIGSAVVASSGTEVRGTVWRTVATGTWSAGSITVTPTATESWIARVIKVLAGEFDASTPIGTAATLASAGTAETAVNAPSMTAGSSDGSGKLINWSIVDADPQTIQSGWTQLSTQDIGDLSVTLASRDAVVTDSESISASNVTDITSDSWCSVGFIVRAPTVTNLVYITTSANISAAGADATTSRLTGGTGSFTAGKRADDVNALTIDIVNNNNTELERCLKNDYTNGNYVEFREYRVDTAFNTYTDTPKWTIGSATTSLPVLRKRSPLVRM